MVTFSIHSSLGVFRSPCGGGRHTVKFVKFSGTSIHQTIGDKTANINAVQTIFKELQVGDELNYPMEDLNSRRWPAAVWFFRP